MAFWKGNRFITSCSHHQVFIFLVWLPVTQWNIILKSHFLHSKDILGERRIQPTFKCSHSDLHCRHIQAVAQKVISLQTQRYFYYVSYVYCLWHRHVQHLSPPLSLCTPFHLFHEPLFRLDRSGRAQLLNSRWNDAPRLSVRRTL